MTFNVTLCLWRCIIKLSIRRTASNVNKANVCVGVKKIKHSYIMKDSSAWEYKTSSNWFDIHIMRHIFSNKSKRISCTERLQAAVVKSCAPQQFIPLTDNKCTKSAKLSTFLFTPPTFSLPLGPELQHLVSKLQMCFLGTVLRRSHAVFTTPLTREEKGWTGPARRPWIRSRKLPELTWNLLNLDRFLLLPSHSTPRLLLLLLLLSFLSPSYLSHLFRPFPPILFLTFCSNSSPLLSFISPILLLIFAPSPHILGRITISILLFFQKCACE